MNIYLDFKPNSQPQPQTTEKTTKKPKKSKREAEGPSKILFTKNKSDEF